MRIELSANHVNPEELVYILEGVSRQIEDGRRDAIIRDSNGNKVGQWRIIDWTNTWSVLDYAAEKNLTVNGDDLATEDGVLYIDGTEAEEWFSNMLSD